MTAMVWEPRSGAGALVPDPIAPRLTVAAAARRLGIAPATLRTWDRRYGIGPSGHVPGRHRRYAPDDVARLELMLHALVRGASAAEAARYARCAPAKDPAPAAGSGPVEEGAPVAAGVAPAGRAQPVPLLMADVGELARVRVGGRVLRLPGSGRRARGLGRAALGLDHVAVQALLEETIEADGLTFAWDQVARPVLAAVAQRWADTGAGVEVEHLLSECVVRVFGSRSAPAATARPVLLAGMPGEFHTLPMTVLAAVLAADRVCCRTLGPNLPVDALAAAIRRTAPAAIVLWSQTPATADTALVANLPRTRPRFRPFVAGPGWATADLPPRVGLLSSLTEATTVVGEAMTV